MQSRDRNDSSSNVEMPAFGHCGADRDALVASLERWVRSDAMQRLAVASGWPWPDGPLEATLADLARRSVEWDFRNNRERHALTSLPARVGDRLLDEAMVKTAAAELGLAGRWPITGRFTHVVPLGGMAMACRRRCREAARQQKDLNVRRVALLTAHRLLAGHEPADTEAAGWGRLELESEAAVAAARETFDLPEAPDHETVTWWTGDPSAAPQGVAPDEWCRRQSWAHHEWRRPDLDVEVVVAPSSDPPSRRTNTADQLVFWAQRAGIGATDRLLLVTTEHYVPAQTFEAIRALGLRWGCDIETCGVEWMPAGPYRGAAYLQEVRSALLAAVRLLDAIGRLAP